MRHGSARCPAFVCLLVAVASLSGAAWADAAASGALVSTGSTSSITSSSAVLHGSINPRGAPTSFAFQYGPTRRYGAQTPIALAGSGKATVGVSQAIAGLHPDTTYHYRLVAFASTTTAGRDRSFRTSKVPLSLAISGVPNPVLFGNAFLLEGNLSGTGSAGRRVVLKVNPFPYLSGFRPFESPTVTSATGSFSFFVPGLLENTQMLVSVVGKPSVSSLPLLEGVAVRVALHVRHTRRPGFVRLYGTVAPAEVGALVGFQLVRRHHRSVNEGGTLVRAGTPTVSRFSRIIHIRHRGLYRALVRVNDPAHVSNYSALVLIR
jgi:hypothetical protein